ncbi:MAG: SdpI family protein [Clostridia bacterium]|nr:SdpI family protein [Clostridia bacterium]
MGEFLKNNKTKLIISSLLILLPMAVGLILWDSLPQQMSTHWGADGNADGSSSKAFAVFGLPLILLALHLLCVLTTSFDKRNLGQNKKVFSLVFFITPVISWFSCGVIYASALGAEFSIASAAYVVIGIMFAVIGNYLPKCRRNSTIGIKIKWTLESEANWNATHRLAGKLWFFGGFAMILLAFFPQLPTLVVLLALLALLALVPCVYSYRYSKREKK